jgi:hypothetical protein
LIPGRPYGLRPEAARILQSLSMVQELKRPVELAALKGRLERAQRVQARIAHVGGRYDKVLTAIEEKTDQASGHVGYLEQYDAALDKTIKDMIGGSNEEKKFESQPTNGAGTEAEIKP